MQKQKCRCVDKIPKEAPDYSCTSLSTSIERYNYSCILNTMKTAVCKVSEDRVACSSDVLNTNQ